MHRIGFMTNFPFLIVVKNKCKTPFKLFLYFVDVFQFLKVSLITKLIKVMYWFENIAYRYIKFINLFSCEEAALEGQSQVCVSVCP